MKLGPKCFKVEVQESEGTQLFMNVIEIFGSIDGEGSSIARFIDNIFASS